MGFGTDPRASGPGVGLEAHDLPENFPVAGSGLGSPTRNPSVAPGIVCDWVCGFAIRVCFALRALLALRGGGPSGPPDLAG